MDLPTVMEIMGVINFKSINTQDLNSNLIQSNISDVINRIQQTPFFGGNVISASLTTGQANPIAHKLGRQPQLWILFDQQQNSIVWRNSWDASSIDLRCSANCTIQFWVN